MIFRVSTQGEAEGAPCDRGLCVRLRTKPAVKQKCYYGKTESGFWNGAVRRNTKGGKLQESLSTEAEGEVSMQPASADNAAKSPANGWLLNGLNMVRLTFQRSNFSIYYYVYLLLSPHFQHYLPNALYFLLGNRAFYLHLIIVG